MFDSKFYTTMVSLVVAVVLICNYNPKKKEIVASINLLFSEKFKHSSKNVINPYAKKDTSKQEDSSQPQGKEKTTSGMIASSKYSNRWLVPRRPQASQVAGVVGGVGGALVGRLLLLLVDVEHGAAQHMLSLPLHPSFPTGVLGEAAKAP